MTRFHAAAAVIAMVTMGAACREGGAAIERAAVAAETAAANIKTVAAVEPPPPEYREVTLPAGTVLRLQLTSAVASDSSRVEDAVRGELRQPLRSNGGTLIPAGAGVAGVVTYVERAGRVKGRAQVAYRFDALQYGSERYRIQTAPISHRAAATKGSDAKKIAIGAGAGAALGAMLGGGDGAAKGAAIGGAGGTGVVLATRGKEVRLGPGAEVNTRLTAPLTVRVGGRSEK